MSRRIVPTSFPQWPSHALWCHLFKKANHFMMTTLNIRFDLMATWECAKQVQASAQLLCKRNACALNFRELKKNLHRSRGYRCVHLQFAELELFYQTVNSVKGPATGQFIRSCVSLLSEADRACCVGYCQKRGDHLTYPKT